MALRRHGRRGRSDGIGATWLPPAAATDRSVRLALAVGRNVGGAVVRNRLRRRIRALFAVAAPGVAPGTYLVSAGPSAADLSFPALGDHLGRALDRAGAR
jgi:ribonuclease P protein component